MRDISMSDHEILHGQNLLKTQYFCTVNEICFSLSSRVFIFSNKTRKTVQKCNPAYNSSFLIFLFFFYFPASLNKFVRVPCYWLLSWAETTATNGANNAILFFQFLNFITTINVRFTTKKTYFLKDCIHPCQK